MSKECFFFGKRAFVGRVTVHRGIAKKFKGIGLKLVKSNKRVFYPNLKRKVVLIKKTLRRV
jgi:ribosomal protein L28